MSDPENVPLADQTAIENLAYKWAESYDHKKWDMLKEVLGPSIRTEFPALKWLPQENLTPDQFVAIISSPKVIGAARLKTKHLLGGKLWDVQKDGTVQVNWQLVVTHQYSAAGEIPGAVVEGVAYGDNQHTYKKIDGVWKIVGISARIDWTKGDFFGTMNITEGA